MAQDLTLAQFVERHHVKLAAERTDANPAMPDSRDMDHWKVTLRAQGRRMSLVFSQGYGHNGKKPDVASVLDCLASDASSFDNAQSFEDWAADMGWDTDSRKAERTFKAIKRQSERLKRFLGSTAAYETLLYHTERL